MKCSRNVRNVYQIIFPVLLALIFCGFLPGAAYPAKAAQVTVGVANVRMQPESDAEIIGTLLEDTEIRILRWSGEWAQVEGAGLSGWMHQSVLSASPEDTVTVDREAVNLRTGPGTEYDLAGSAVKGDRLILLDGSQEWYFIQTQDGVTAYILGSLTAEGAGSAGNTEVPSVSGPVWQNYIEITGLEVNLRTGPGTEYESAGTVLQGEVLLCSGQSGDWFVAQTGAGQTVYVYTGLARMISQTVQPPAASVPAEPPAPVIPVTPSVSPDDDSAPTVYINGVYLAFADVEPMILEGRTLVPLRAVFEALGAEVSWIADTQTAVGVGSDGTIVVLPVGASEATVNGAAVQLDVPAQIIDDRTMVPLRFVGESLGGTVSWDGSTRRIDITQSLPMEDPLPPVVTEPEPPTDLPELPSQEVPGGMEVTTPVTPNITPAEPSNIEQAFDINRSYLHVATEKNEIGLSITLSSMDPLVPQATKEGDILTMDFAGMYLSAPVHMVEALGGGDLKIDAENTSTGVRMLVTMPESVECTFSTSEDGKKMSLIVENRIREVTRQVYGESDEMITIATVVPVKYQYFIEGERNMELVLSNTTMGIAREEYEYLGSVMKLMTVQEVEGIDGPEVHLALETKEDCKFNTLLDANGVLNIVITAVTSDAFSPLNERLVMLDAGHGGTEKGALYGGIDERELNLAITLKTGAYLQSKGIEVVYIRQGDNTVELLDRPEIANMQRVGLYVSIHCNAATSTSANGTETYFYAPLDNPMLFAQRMERQHLASCIQRNTVMANGLTDRGVKEKNLAVLRETKMPSALVECGFMSNSAELQKLTDPAFQERLALGISNGIIEYLDSSLTDLTITPNLQEDESENGKAGH